MYHKISHRFPLIEYINGRKMIGGVIGHGTTDEEALAAFKRPNIRHVFLIPENEIIQFVLPIKDKLKQEIIPEGTQKFVLIEYTTGLKMIDGPHHWSNQEIIDDCYEHPNIKDVTLISEDLLLIQFQLGLIK